MHSPPIEWTVLIGSLAAIDYVRARGEADADTLSEVVRDVVQRHPHGHRIFAVGLTVGGVSLYRHICRPT